MRKYYACLTALLSLLLLDCTTKPKPMEYTVKQVSTSPAIDAAWDKSLWNGIEALEIKNFMGEKPIHFPDTRAKIAYDAEAIYVIFQVHDQYVKAVYQNNQDPVYKDSCVEFFFSPASTSQNGYFNLEMNCGGTMLLYHQKDRGKDRIAIDDAHIGQIEVAHTMPEIVNPEIEDETTWVVEYRIPFSILREYNNFEIPAKGTVWRANLYKCADDTSHPHWLTWSPIDYPKPNFHLPEFFGKLIFD